MSAFGDSVRAFGDWASEDDGGAMGRRIRRHREQALDSVREILKDPEALSVEEREKLAEIVRVGGRIL